MEHVPGREPELRAYRQRDREAHDDDVPEQRREPAGELLPVRPPQHLCVARVIFALGAHTASSDADSMSM
jgi:hypothetical protein